MCYCDVLSGAPLSSTVTIAKLNRDNCYLIPHKLVVDIMFVCLVFDMFGWTFTYPVYLVRLAGLQWSFDACTGKEVAGGANTGGSGPAGRS